MLKLKLLRTKYGFTQSEIAKQMGVSQAAYSKWESEQRQMDYDKLVAAAKLFNVSIDYLLGRAEKRTDVKSKIKSIPVYGDVGLDRNTLTAEIIGYEPIGHRLLKKGSYFGLRIADNSMAPRMLKNDILIVHRQHECKSGDLIVLWFDKSFITVKKIFKYSSGIVLMDINTDKFPKFFTRQEIKDREFRILGKVVEFRGKV